MPECAYWDSEIDEKQHKLISAKAAMDVMEFLAEQVNAGRAVLFSPRLQDSPSFPYEVFIDNRLWMGQSLAEAISKAANDVLNETEEDT